MSGRRFRPIANVSVASRVALVALGVTMTSLLVTATVGLVRGDDLVDGVIRDRVISGGASRATDAEIYMRGLRREMAALSLSPGIAEAVEELSAAYDDVVSEGASADTASDVTEFYLTEIVPQLEQGRPGKTSAANLIPSEESAVALQAAYSIPKVRGDDEDAAPVDPALIDDAGDGSAYSEVHADLHAGLRTIADRSDFEDLLLIDARRRVVVYSVRKRIDFATSLELGPHSGSSLAGLVEAVADDPEAGTARLADFAPYAPASDRATAFLVSPVQDPAGELVGFIAVAIGTSRLNEIMNGGGSFEGLGDTGEAYIAGADALMRTDARAYLESPNRYVSEPDQGGNPSLTSQQRELIAHFGTTALFQPVNRKVVDAAVVGRGTMDNTSYVGVDVLTAYRSLDVDDVDWVVFSEVSLDEFQDPLEDYARDLLFAVALFVVVVTFVAVSWSTRLMSPIRTIASRLRRVRTADEIELGALHDEATGDVTDGGPDEYRDLNRNITRMLDELRARRVEREERRAERRSYVARFLPAALARRAERDAGDVLDHVPFATVVTMVLHGVVDLQGSMGQSEIREMVSGFVDEADGLAADFGLERVKVAGDAYFAVCGVSRPYLDHTIRSVRFAFAAVEMVREYGVEHGVEISLGAGVASGGVAVGLAGQDGLVYDSWGPAVSEAAALARRAGPDQVVVSAGLAEVLSDEAFTRQHRLDDGAVRVEAMVAEERR